MAAPAKSRSGYCASPNLLAISEIFVVPGRPAAVAVAPYVSAIPYRRNAEENDPRMKYFNEDSFERTSVRRNPAITYVAIERISRPRKRITRSPPDAINIIPEVAKSRRE